MFSFVFVQLCSRVTAVIHLAWALDFNFPLSAFEAHVRGTHHLLALARASGAQFVFASSVGVAQGWKQSAERYPEEVVLDANFAVGNGYGEGKYVAERVRKPVVHLRVPLPSADITLKRSLPRVGWMRRRCALDRSAEVGMVHGPYQTGYQSS